MTLKIGSLFSGYGGLDMAVEHVFGAEPAWFCEFDKYPAKILAHHWPDVPNHWDITKVDWSQVEPIDILTGGYPCQPFSTAGKRKGTDDDRHLWPHVREAIRALRPRYTILENVSGHRSLGFDRVLGDMAEDGLHVRWASVRASDAGAPHPRERLFIVATFANTQDIRFDRYRAARWGRNGPADNSGPRVGWGDYGPAVSRWEAIVGPAPFPVEAGTKGQPRLRAEFAEWLMGLPAGWVTSPEIGLARTRQISAIGNGVCPQQAEFALRHLLPELERAK